MDHIQANYADIPDIGGAKKYLKANKYQNRSA